jgi:hypothetical protein
MEAWKSVVVYEFFVLAEKKKAVAVASRFTIVLLHHCVVASFTHPCRLARHYCCCC